MQLGNYHFQALNNRPLDETQSQVPIVWFSYSYQLQKKQKGSNTFFKMHLHVFLYKFWIAITVKVDI